MRYRCLVLDHDDTAVDSTAWIHHPAHVQSMKRLRPDQLPLTLDQWFLKNYNPGILKYMVEELALSEEEMREEYEIWRKFTGEQIPHFYPGFLEALTAFKSGGGKIAVVSHSEKEFIERDYRANNFLPDLIYGWEEDDTKRKPHPWPLLDAMRQTGVSPSETLVVDDLKPGVTMARAAGVDMAAAGWAHSIPEIERYMRGNCTVYFERVADFAAFILGAG
jgi:phosphoglycolate phosphatase/pyrophosphatase PpaX